MTDGRRERIGLLWVGDDYLLLDHVPLLTASLGQGLPDFLAHAHVLLTQALELARVPVISTLPLHQAFVPFPARVARLGREVVCLNLAPVVTARAGG